MLFKGKCFLEYKASRAGKRFLLRQGYLKKNINKMAKQKELSVSLFISLTSSACMCACDALISALSLSECVCVCVYVRECVWRCVGVLVVSFLHSHSLPHPNFFSLSFDILYFCIPITLSSSFYSMSLCQDITICCVTSQH